MSPPAERIGAEHPDTDKNMAIRAVPERLARPFPTRTLTALVPTIGALALAVLVLRLACMNVVNLQLVRATVRQRHVDWRVFGYAFATAVFTASWLACGRRFALRGPTRGR